MPKQKSAISATKIGALHKTSAGARQGTVAGGSATSGGGRNPKSEIEFTSGSVEETQAFGERLGRTLRPGDIVALYGELGSGKTTLIQGIAQGLGRNPETIKSPTFVLMREYPGEVPLVHIDGYRLEGPPAVAWLEVELIFSPQKITMIEWAERFAGLLPDERFEVHLEHVSTNRRRIHLIGQGARGQETISKVEASCLPEITGPTG